MATVATGPLEVTVEDEGITRIREVYTVSAPIGGKLLRTRREVGDEVAAGKTVVATIEPTEPNFLDARTQSVNAAAVQAAQAAVDLAEAQIKQAKAQLEFTRSDLRRAEELAASRTISARALEKAKLDVDSAEAAVASAVATMEVRRRELESARAHMIQPGQPSVRSASCCVEVHSPIDGRVLKIIAESEQVVQAGAPLLELGDPHDLEIVVDFLSRDAVRIKPDQPARIESWGGDTILNARVKRIEPTGFTKVSALGIEEQRVKVILDFTGPETEWRELGHGYRIIARVVVWHGEGVLVPLGALFRQGESWAVFVVADGRAQRRLIKIGERNLHAARVVYGLKVGEQVILHPSDRVADGVRIEPRA
ncbi:MAG: HlyD family efflux transporter periplasmic adaptor subunit [Pseudolabrys sp.]|nr:HlyD family efflux transporter periplasmic adaptor subunit [Pseudolabrys sp.]